MTRLSSRYNSSLSLPRLLETISKESRSPLPPKESLAFSSNSCSPRRRLPDLRPRFRASDSCKSYGKHYADEVKQDTHGNQWFVLNPKGAVRVMICAHTDEIGLMVRLYRRPVGFIWVTRIGAGLIPVQHWGQRVYVQTRKGPVLGVIGKKPIHNTLPEDRTKGPKLEDLYIDIGAKDKAEALKLVRLGDPVTMAGGMERMPNDLAIARGMDDRIGVFVALETLRKLNAITHKKKNAMDCAFYAVCSVQEEVGLRGATTAAYSINPHVGIAIDVGFATDYPSENKKMLGDFKLGGGPILHRGANINLPLADIMEGAADKHNIPYQLSGDGGIMGTDAGAIQVSRQGARRRCFRFLIVTCTRPLRWSVSRMWSIRPICWRRWRWASRTRRSFPSPRFERGIR